MKRTSPRIFKKLNKRCVQLLRSYGMDIDFTPSKVDHYPIPYALFGFDREKRMEKRQPSLATAWNRIEGIPLHWHRCSYESDEWDAEFASSIWREYHYWEIGAGTRMKVEDWQTEEMPKYPVVSLEERRHRMSTKAVAPGWKWRGKRVIPINKTTGGFDCKQ